MKLFSEVSFLFILTMFIFVGFSKDANALAQVCTTSLRPSDPISTDPYANMGNEGYILIESGTCDPTGVTVINYVCSTGATNSYCPSDPAFQHQKTKFGFFFDALRKFAGTGQYILIHSDSSTTDSAGVKNIDFHHNNL